MNRDPVCPPEPQTASVRIVRRERAGPVPTDAQSLCAGLYAARGAGGADLGLARLHPLSALAGAARAAECLADTICRGGSILVVGDYDADGATGTVVALLGLRALGAARVDYLVPSRFAFGYGLSPEVVDVAAERHPDLILTVDNGIASLAGVDRAKTLGIPVVITDHHLPGPVLPDAAAIVNPSQPTCTFPSKHLAGVGVIFYLLAAVRAHLQTSGWLGPARSAPKLAELLDLVALGTVADVVTLDDNNRVLVEQGLRRIRAGRCRPGVRALLGVAGRTAASATARDLAFAVAPRLNAAGRLADMSLGVECLLAEDPRQALEMARKLDRLNRERRAIEDGMQAEAEALLAGLRLDDARLGAGLCLFAPGWHQGVTGILAARLRERYHRPVVAFAEADDSLLRGSARSIEGLHIRDLIARIDQIHPGLIARFGGHAMAAGLSLRPAAFEEFRDAYTQLVSGELGEGPLVRELVSDGELPAALLTLATAEHLRLAGPWGKGFPEPLFDGPFEVLDRRVVAERHLRLRVRADGGWPIDAIGFNQASRLREAVGTVHIAYRLDVNDHQGLRAPQLILEHLQSIRSTSRS